MSTLQAQTSQSEQSLFGIEFTNCTYSPINKKKSQTDYSNSMQNLPGTLV